MKRMRLYIYDVEGNEKDGYTVKEIGKSSYVFTIPDNATDQDIEKILQCGELSLKWDGKNSCYLSDTYTEQPLGELLTEEE